MILLAINLDIQSPAVGAYQCEVKLVMVDSELWDRSSR
jgi:hypothetical protein